ncbi:MAG: FAD-binding oxidoreductase, partial [Nitrospinota bacterium]
MPASLDAFARAVESDTGDPRLLSGEGTGMYALGGRTPSLIARPAGHEAAARLLARADEAGLGVVPWGGGTGRRAGYPPERYEVALSTERMAGAVDFLKEDLTAVVQPGMTVEALNRLTAPEGQTAGLDPPHPGRATVGGAIIAERSGPMRVRWGRARDRVMRLRAALAGGATHTYGALVVKNVTGYDMNRLLAGSWGTLAVVTELAVRLYKAPERTGARAAGFATAEAAFAAAGRLMALPLFPLWVEAVDAGRIAALGERYPLPGPWCLAAAFGDFEEGLADQLDRFEALLSREGGQELRRLDDEETQRLGAALADQPGGDFAREDALAVRASARADELPRFARAAAEAARRGGFRHAIGAHAGSGVLRAWLAPEERGVEPRAAWEAFAALCRAGADPSRGRAVHVRLDAGPTELREAVAVWGEDGLDPASLDLMRRIKREYDPKRTLSPGRFLG